MNTPFFEFVATNIKTGEVIVLRGSTQMKEHGFTPTAIYAVVAGKNLHHKGYTFKRKQIKHTEE